MTEETKRKGKEKKGRRVILPELIGIQTALQQSAAMHVAMMQSSAIQNVLRERALMQETIMQSTMWIQAMARYQEEINRRLEEVARRLFYPSFQAMKAVMEARKNIQNVVQQYANVQEMIKRSVPTLALVSEIKAISPRSERAVQSLYNYIAILEAELAKKDEELAKKDKKISELIKLLKEAKKELEEKYVV